MAFFHGNLLQCIHRWKIIKTYFLNKTYLDSNKKYLDKNATPRLLNMTIIITIFFINSS